ncbi:hypothetical protein PM082_007550 [Marasmius tenuissimus]|nr:hypothetical protein PM082_007550 [Marasmius tenuissimus]
MLVIGNTASMNAAPPASRPSRPANANPHGPCRSSGSTRSPKQLHVYSQTLIPSEYRQGKEHVSASPRIGRSNAKFPRAVN